jgi:hypothetical protein
LQFVCDDALEHAPDFISLWHPCSFVDQIESFVLPHIHANTYSLLYSHFSVAGNKITSLYASFNQVSPTTRLTMEPTMHGLMGELNGWRLEGCSQPCRGSF